MVELASEYGRYGYRRVTALLRAEGRRVNASASSGSGGREGLKVPARQPKRNRLWDNDGSCARPRPERRDHVWAYDLVHDRTNDGRALRMLTDVDEFTRECLAIDVGRGVTSEDVLERLSDLFVRRGVPAHIRSDNGPEFTAKRVREWLGRVGVSALYIEPGSPWEDGYCESFNGELRDELLDREAFDTVLEAKVLIERWRREYNGVRPHSRLAHRPPAPEAYGRRSRGALLEPVTPGAPPPADGGGGRHRATITVGTVGGGGSRPPQAPSHHATSMILRF